MKKTILALLFSVAIQTGSSAQTPAAIELSNLQASTFQSGAVVSFDPLPDASICYLLFIQQDGQVTQANPWTLETKAGSWLQALGWFSPTGNAFWDDRPTSIGPPVPVYVYMMSNALPGDGKTRAACIAIYRKVKTETGGSMELVGYSQNFNITAPNLTGTTSTTSTTTTVTTETGTTTTTTQTTTRVRSKGKR